jgi:hypothetical protein
MMAVARVEKDLVAHLHATTDRPVGSSSFLRFFDVGDDVKDDPDNAIHVYLVARSARASATTSDGAVQAQAGVFEI